MTKRIMSQNVMDKDENREITTGITAPTESSEYSNDSESNSSNQKSNENAFCTPIKQIKFHSDIQQTPKKKNRFMQYDDLPIVGKNLIIIFESM